MYKKQMILQRIVCYALLIAAVLVFIYSLGIVTDLYDSLFPYADSSKRKFVTGADIYYNIQPFNKQFTVAGIALILSAVSIFVFNTHKRRKYYVGNYIAIGLNSALTIGVSVWGILNVVKYKKMYYEIDFEALERWQELLKKPCDISPFWFNVGFYVFGIAISAAVLGVLNLVFKVLVMRSERMLLEGGAV